MIHSKTRNLGMISYISKLGMCIFKECFVQLSVGMGEIAIDMNEKDEVVLLTYLLYLSLILMLQLSPRLMSYGFMEQMGQLIKICHLKTKVSSEFSLKLCQPTLN